MYLACKCYSQNQVNLNNWRETDWQSETVLAQPAHFSTLFLALAPAIFNSTKHSLD